MIFNNKFNKEKIFCIGFNKTGTTTLEKVFKSFQYNLGNQERAEQLLNEYSKRNFRPILDYCCSADAFQDVPFSLPHLYVYLDQFFSKAKFVLTVRDSEEQWYNSITKFHSKKFADGNRIPNYEDLKKAFYRNPNFVYESYELIYGTDVPPYDKERFCGMYNNHIASVRYYFKHKPNFIEINVSNNDDYFRLADFLKKKPIDSGFPWMNKT
jgi:hypothetical protein